jgi:exodeoxyribonuclease VIII
MRKENCKLENGIYYNLDFDAYRALDRLNCSTLKQLTKCPAAMVATEYSDAFAFGTACHSYIGENIMPVVSPKFDKRTKEGKSNFEAFKLKHLGKVIVTEDEWESMQGMRDSVYGHAEAAQLYSKGRSEVTVLFEYLGVPCKARMDWVTHDNMIVDLKTCQSASIFGFRKAVVQYHYDLQSCFYQLALDSVGVSPRGFKFIAVEKTPPYMTNVFQIESDWDQSAMERIDALVEEYKTIDRSKPLPAYTSPECIILAKPSYL